MARSRNEAVTLGTLRGALRLAAEDFLRRVAKAHPGETMYGFLFEISATQFGAHGAVGTEEGLTRYAEKFVAGEYGADFDNDVEKAKAAFRWGSTEDAWYQQPEEAFDEVNKLLGRAEEQELYEPYGDALEKLCVEVLREMDAAGRFGTGKDRERVGIGICFIGGDNSEEEFLGWARQVNPQKVYRRMRREYLGEAAS
jgi:hypothetical protein